MLCSTNTSADRIIMTLFSQYFDIHVILQHFYRIMTLFSQYFDIILVILQHYYPFMTSRNIFTFSEYYDIIIILQLYSRNILTFT